MYIHLTDFESVKNNSEVDTGGNKFQRTKRGAEEKESSCVMKSRLSSIVHPSLNRPCDGRNEQLGPFCPGTFLHFQAWVELHFEITHNMFLSYQKKKKIHLSLVFY